MQILYSPQCLEYQSPNHPESPQRISRACEFLKLKGFEFLTPAACGDQDILLAHSPRLL